jgi:hypothetical protein
MHFAHIAPTFNDELAQWLVFLMHVCVCVCVCVCIHPHMQTLYMRIIVDTIQGDAPNLRWY